MKLKLSTKLVKYLKRFAKQEGVSNKLDKLCDLAHKRERCGFEKWLQFELYLFFKAENVMDVKVEKVVTPDKRSSNKTRFHVDVEVTLNSGDSLSLELKTRINAKSAIRALFKDTEKFAKTRKNGKSTANFAVVFCAEAINEAQKQKLKKENGDLAEFNIVDVGAHHFFIAESE